MGRKTKSEWKTYNEMNVKEQLEFKIYEGWKLYPSRIRSNEVEYLILK